MRPLTKKYIFECKLKGEPIKIWAEYYGNGNATWLKDVDILEDAGIITSLDNEIRTFLYDTVVIYPADQYNPSGIKHWLHKDTTLVFKKGSSVYDTYPNRDDDY